MLNLWQQHNQSVTDGTACTCGCGATVTLTQLDEQLKATVAAHADRLSAIPTGPDRAEAYLAAVKHRDFEDAYQIGANLGYTRSTLDNWISHETAIR